MNAKKTSSKYAPKAIDEENTVPNVRALKTATCKSLSGRSTLTYEVGTTEDREIHLRIKSNSGHGCFGKDWMPLRALQQALAKATRPITSGTLLRVFAGKSANTSGFVTAAMLSEGLLEPLGNARGYAPADGSAFWRDVKQLLEKVPTRALAESTPKKTDSTKTDATMPLTKKATAPSKTKTAKR